MARCTYWLLDGLRKAGPNVSYKTIYDGIVAKVHGQFTEQTPQLQGEGNRALFRSDEIKPYYAVSVMNVDGDHVDLAAGEAHSIQIGSQFALYPQATLDFSTEQGRLAVVEVDKLLPDGVSSRAKVVQKLTKTPIDQGAQAVLLNNVDLRLQRNVLVDIKKAALRKQVTAAITAGGKGFIKAARAGDPLDFQVTLDKEGNYLRSGPGRRCSAQHPATSRCGGCHRDPEAGRSAHPSGEISHRGRPGSPRCRRNVGSHCGSSW